MTEKRLLPPSPLAKRPVTIREAGDRAIEHAMAHDPGLLLVAPDRQETKGSRLAAPAGSFGALRERFGPDRVLTLGYAPSTVMDIAFGAAVSGSRVLLDLTHVPEPHGLVEPILKRGAASLPDAGLEKLVIRAVRRVEGPGARAMALAAVQSRAMALALPSTPGDAAGLMAQALHGHEPTLILEPAPRGAVPALDQGIPDPSRRIPFGEAACLRRGWDLTVVALSGLAGSAAEAADQLDHEEGLSCAVLDPRTLVPLDREAVLDSVERTGRLLVLDQEESDVTLLLSALIAETMPHRLVAPVRRVAVPLSQSGSLDITHILRDAAHALSP